MTPLFHAVVVFAVSIASVSAGAILLKLGMDRFGTLPPALQALVKTPQLPLGSVLMIVQFLGIMLLFKWGRDASVVIPIMGLCYVGTAILGVFFAARSATQAKVP